MKHQTLIKKLRAGLKSDVTGNKANSLIFLHRYGFNIPLTYLVTVQAHERFVAEGAIVIEELKKELANLPDKIYAVRSSTTAEDSKDFTFAGQFQTLINVSGVGNILDAIIKVWDSATFLTDNEYVRRSGVSQLACAVIIQEMIPSKLAGVSFSRNPVTDQNEIVIEAVEGFGEELVQKGVTPMRWRIKNDVIFEGDDHHHLIHVIRQVAHDTYKLKRYYGHHIDIEWAYDGEQLFYLQLRKITARKEINIYSNKMAREMLPGQVKPLVWSVNIQLVNSTWIDLISEITGPLKIKPDDLAKPFYFQAYFNVSTLSRVFSEFGLSSDNLEQLMIRDDGSKHSFKPGLKTLKHSFRIIRFLYTKLRFEKRYLREYDYLKSKSQHLEKQMKENFSLENYPEYYATLFADCKRITYLNIVIPMLMTISHKKLKKRLKRISLDYNNLDFGPDFPLLAVYSPSDAMQKIKDEIEALPAHIREKILSLEDLRKHKEADHITERIDSFINDFGHFSESGNDLSYPKWKEDPEMVFKMITDYSTPEKNADHYSLSEMKNTGIKTSPSLMRLYMKAGRFKVYREQISSLYIFGYGLFRLIFLKLGIDFASRGIINSENDIFYLSKEEVDGIINKFDTSSPVNYRELIMSRKNEMDQTKDIPLPPVIYGEEAPLPDKGNMRNKSGTGTSPGTFTGTTRVVRRTEDFSSVVNGEVLLIPFSDVSWTSVLVNAGAIVSETGGMLSHSSIIAREMGIPSLASVANACAVGSGKRVTVNGSNGLLTIHDDD